MPAPKKTPPAGEPPAAPKKAAGAPPALSPEPNPTCRVCRFWGPPDVQGMGPCKASPPTVPLGLPLVGLTPVFGYPRTAPDLPACGRFTPR
jgi:hypothetical protein